MTVGAHPGDDREGGAMAEFEGPEEPPATITPYPDGPLIVRGSFELCELDGTPIPRSGRAVALCRCGRSAVKPFCDGSHKLAAGAGRSGSG
jgi:CDGSH-type Zn-finger protein